MFPIKVHTTLHCIVVCLHYVLDCKCHKGRNHVVLFSDESPVYSIIPRPHEVPNKWSMMLLLLCNYIEALASFPIKIPVDTIIARVTYFYREVTSLPRP